MNLWLDLSNLGDVATTGIVAAMIAAGLMFGRTWPAASLWCVLMVIEIALVVASKIAFLGWGWGICALDFTGFSGHAARAMTIGPVLFYLVLNRASRAHRAAGVLLGVALGLAVGVSRLALHVHSPSEVVAGWMLGGGNAFLFIRIGKDLKSFELKKYATLIGVLMLSVLPAPEAGATQKLLVDLSIFFSGHATAFSRQDCSTEKHEKNIITMISPIVHLPVVIFVLSPGSGVYALKFPKDVLV